MKRDRILFLIDYVAQHFKNFYQEWREARLAMLFTLPTRKR
jgi:hypothetical protein